MRTVRITAAAAALALAATLGAYLVSPERTAPAPVTLPPVDPLTGCPEGYERLAGALCLQYPPADPYGATWEDLRPFGSYDRVLREQVRGFRHV